MVDFEVVTSDIRTNKVSGSFKIKGLKDPMNQMPQFTFSGPVDHTRDSYISPLLDEGRWQMKFTISSGAVDVYFQAKPTEKEELSANGERIGNYHVSIWFKAPGFISPVINSDRQRWKPSGQPADSWCVRNWIQQFHFHDSNIFASRFMGVDGPTDPHRPVFDPQDSVTVTWSIETRRTEEYPRHQKNPSSPNAVADLFDDKDASNVVFVISNPRNHSRHEEYIYAHTKILSARCEYFETMFRSGFSEGVPVVNGSAFGAQDLLDFADSDYENNENDQSQGTSAVQAGTTLSDDSSVSNRRIVRITDTSYKTYHAMLYYLYTGSYSFSPLTSSSTTFRSETNGATQNEFGATELSRPRTIETPRSSAKSMYRLSRRLDISELKTAALEYIEDSLTPQNITTEICSVFTSRFPEIREIETKYLMSHWNEIKNSSNFCTFIAGLFDGKPNGVGDTWLEVFRKLPAN